MADPVYLQVAADLSARTESDELSRGQQLPTEPELRTVYGVSRNTIRDAVKWLAGRGQVGLRPGVGAFAAKIDPFVTTLSANPDTGPGGGEGAAFGSEVEARSRMPSATSPRVEIQQATGSVAAELQLEEGTGTNSSSMSAIYRAKDQK